MLCDREASSSYGAAQCRWLNGGCQGAATGNNEANNCYPNWLWSGSEIGVYYGGHGLNGGSLAYGANSCGTGMYGKCALGYAFSVRCVLDLICILRIF